MLVGSCTGTGTNSKAVFSSVSGTTTLAATVGEGVTVSSVKFTVDDKEVGNDTDPANGWTVSFDTTTVTPGLHYVKAIGSPDNVELLHASILVANQGSGAPAGGTPAAGGGTAAGGTTTQ